jgi:hypothetical protein
MTTVIHASDFNILLQKGLKNEIKSLKNDIDLSRDLDYTRSMQEKLRFLKWMLKIISNENITQQGLIEIVEMEIKRYKHKLNRVRASKPEERVYDSIESLEWLRTAIISTNRGGFNSLPFYKETILISNQFVIDYQ